MTSSESTLMRKLRRLRPDATELARLIDLLKLSRRMEKVGDEVVIRQGENSTHLALKREQTHQRHVE